jgi:Glycosyl transferase 4-like domain
VRLVLIISPHFPPSNTADMQRVRMLMPFFEENGWCAEVLAVQPQQVAAPQDDWLVEGLPANVTVNRVKALGLRWSRIPGLGTLGFRALLALAKAGDRLLSKKRFDAIYFSTTVFECHLLGPRWKRKFGVPFVMDYQDPWVNDYYREHPEVLPPGGRFKYFLVDWLHRRMEPKVLANCAGITSVSAAYPKQIRQRYSGMESLPTLVEGFPGASRDFERLSQSNVLQSCFSANDDMIHWVYLGVVIPGMCTALRALFHAVSSEFSPAKKARIRMHFIGTSYAPAGEGRPMVMPLAEDYGIGDMVDEHSARIPYSEGLACLMGADALLALGSDDPSYTASKIYPCLLARKPLLAIYHQQSSIVSLCEEVGGGVCIPFENGCEIDSLSHAIAEKWVRDRQYTKVVPLDQELFMKHTDRRSASTVCAFLESVCG